MEPPKTVEEIFERKQHARSRFDGMTLIEKIERMFELKRNLDGVFGKRHPGYVPRNGQQHKLMPECLICDHHFDGTRIAACTVKGMICEQCVDDLGQNVSKGRKEARC